MVKGFELFRQRFASFADSFIIIGGAAYDLRLAPYGGFRRTNLILVLFVMLLGGCKYPGAVNKACDTEAFDRVPQEVWLTHEELARLWVSNVEQECGVKVTRVQFEEITNCEAWGYVDYVHGESTESVLVSAKCRENTYIMVNPLPSDLKEHPERYERKPRLKHNSAL